MYVCRTGATATSSSSTALTGDYQFTNCAALRIGGSGQNKRKNGVITLKEKSSGRNVVGKVKTSAGKGSASVRLSSGETVFGISDRSVVNNTCVCE